MERRFLPHILRLLVVQFFLPLLYASSDFTPKINWTCAADSVAVRLINNSPFFGVLHPTGLRTPDCSAAGTGGTTLSFTLPFERCNIHFDRRSKKRTFRLEVHEHSLLILDQDHHVDIECAVKPPTSPPTPLVPEEEDAVENDVGGENATEAAEFLPTQRESKPPEFDVELLPIGSDRPVQLVSHGEMYNLRVELREPTERRFRIHLCSARSEANSVQLVGLNGCSMDRHLIGDFEYEQQAAQARLPSMFRFPDSNSIRFECSLSVCAGKEECKPNCGIKMDDPLAEDPELVSKLLRSSLPDAEDLSASGSAPSSAARRSASSASVLVHVLDRRELPIEPPASSTRPTEPTGGSHAPISITGCPCEYPADLVLLYRLAVGLAILFSLGCLCNVWFCCLSARGRKSTKKRRSVPKTLPPSVITRNSYWINEPVTRDRSGTAFEEFPSQFVETQLQPTLDLAQPPQKRNSLTSYASLRPKVQQPIHSLTTLTSPFYDTGIGGGIGLSTYTTRASPPRSSTAYEVPTRTFHSGTESVGNSPRDSIENQAELNIPAALIASSSSAPGAPPFPSNKETFSIF